MQETILVTGATGTVGSLVVQELTNQDVHVRAGVHSIIKGEKLKQFPDVALVEIEATNPETLKAAFTGVDKLVLITPFAENQLEMSKNLVEAAKKAGVKQIVKLSALGADAEPGIQLGRWHREIEKYIEESGIPYTFLRPATFMQNFSNYYADSIKQGKLYMPLGDGKVSYVDARDIAAVVAEVLTQPGHENKAYNLTGPDALSLTEVAKVLSEELGHQVDYVDVPEQEAYDSMKQMQMPDSLCRAMMELHQVSKGGHSAHITDDIEKITGKRPYTFHEFAHNCRTYFKSE